MKAIFSKIEIKNITFETNDCDVSVQAVIHSGNLSYESLLIVSFSDLNLLINKIQKQIREEKDVSSLFTTEKMDNENLFYQLNLTKEFPTPVVLEHLEFPSSPKQIRA
jgi:hypothetical protein